MKTQVNLDTYKTFKFNDYKKAFKADKSYFKTYKGLVVVSEYPFVDKKGTLFMLTKTAKDAKDALKQMKKDGVTSAKIACGEYRFDKTDLKLKLTDGGLKVDKINKDAKGLSLLNFAFGITTMKAITTKEITEDKVVEKKEDGKGNSKEQNATDKDVIGDAGKIKTFDTHVKKIMNLASKMEMDHQKIIDDFDINKELSAFSKGYMGIDLRKELIGLRTRLDYYAQVYTEARREYPKYQSNIEKERDLLQVSFEDKRKKDEALKVYKIGTLGMKHVNSIYKRIIPQIKAIFQELKENYERISSDTKEKTK